MPSSIIYAYHVGASFNLMPTFFYAIQSLQSGELYCLLSSCKESKLLAGLFDACSLCKGN
jgi:hypothetical protein